LDQWGVVGVMGNTMVVGDLLGASPWSIDNPPKKGFHSILDFHNNKILSIVRQIWHFHEKVAYLKI
jgi:hypothetical protein